MWLTENWQLVTGGMSIVTLAALFWRYGIRVVRLEFRVGQCAEDLRIVKASLQTAREELDALRQSAAHLEATATEIAMSENEPK